MIGLSSSFNYSDHIITDKSILQCQHAKTGTIVFQLYQRYDQDVAVGGAYRPVF